jgi:hypothetical protein
MIWLRWAFAVSVLLAPSVVLGADGEGSSTPPPDRPTSPAAAAALKEYDKASQAADDAWKQAKLVAERKLIEKLKQALAIATRAGSLDEANLINSQIKAATARMEAATPPVLTEGAFLRRAMWVPIGEENKAKDVTEKLRVCLSGSGLQLKDLALGDPANGFHKVLIIDGVFGGLPYTLRVPEGGVNGLAFGPFQAKAK